MARVQQIGTNRVKTMVVVAPNIRRQKQIINKATTIEFLNIDPHQAKRRISQEPEKIQVSSRLTNSCQDTAGFDDKWLA